MFTGLIEEVGHLKSLTPLGPQQFSLTLTCREIQSDLKEGDSVAVDGVCLTVVAFCAGEVRFDLSAHSYQHTLFGKKPLGAPLNLERALKFGDRLGGHLVQGHVDSFAKLVRKTPSGQFIELWFAFEPPSARYLIDRGSVSLNGVSLTIAALEAERFKVAVIPQTLEKTNLGQLALGESLHLETDLIGRYVERLLSTSPPTQESEPTLNADFLRSHGF